MAETLQRGPASDGIAAAMREGLAIGEGCQCLLQVGNNRFKACRFLRKEVEVGQHDKLPPKGATLLERTDADIRQYSPQRLRPHDDENARGNALKPGEIERHIGNGGCGCAGRRCVCVVAFRAATGVWCAYSVCCLCGGFVGQRNGPEGVRAARHVKPGDKAAQQVAAARVGVSAKV